MNHCFESHVALDILFQVWSTMQWWCEGVLFTAFGIAGLLGSLVSIGVLATKDMRKGGGGRAIRANCGRHQISAPSNARLENQTFQCSAGQQLLLLV
jgi:hypothetical protein